MKDDTIYLAHILECIADIERYIGRDAAKFFDNDMRRNAVLRQLQVMAESTQKLSDKAKSSLPEVDWKKLSDFRNVLVHDYLGDIDHTLVWNHIQYRLPELKAAILRIYQPKEKP